MKRTWSLLFAVPALVFSGPPLSEVDPVAVRTLPTCLSISPFRAIPALGRGPSGPEDLRDQVLEALNRGGDSSWIARSAGSCPESMAVLDIFQAASDVVAAPEGPTLRFRLEWRHQPGQTEFFLPCPNRIAPPVDSIAQQLRAVARQMSAQVSVRSTPEGIPFRVEGWSGSDLDLVTPLVLKTPPGAFSVEFSRGGLVRRVDTVVSTGGLYEIDADFRTSRIDPKVVGSMRRTWPWWGATAVAAATTIFFEWRQTQAQSAYSALGPGDPPGRFSARWSDLREANLLRNGFLGLTLVLGTGSAWLEWGRSR
ncbi:MAG TPA: hypothetical protein VN931_07850 [Fibrobacteria bacterium]|nr:hypothetical protein [Fibrobacteria bacterium]